MTDELRIQKNESIREAMKLTHEKRMNQIYRTYKVKLDESAITSLQKESLIRLFLEAKWIYNEMLNFGKDNDIWNYKVPKDSVSVKLPDGSFDKRSLLVIGSQMKQSIHKQICSNIKTLSTLKEKGYQQPGRLKFKSEVTKIHIKQLQKNFICKNNKFVKIPRLGDIRVNGLNQIPDNADFACAELLNTPRGYYISIVTYINKSDIEKCIKKPEIIGVDFGCMNNFTLSNGEKYNCIVEESERLKRLQRKLNRQIKGSNNYKKTILLIKKEYQKQSNFKNDTANKLVHYLVSFEKVVIQDEQLAKWQSNHHGKAVQHSILGRVKSKLSYKENVEVLYKFLPTTKLCNNCGSIHDKLSLYNREFICCCGYTEDRDIHAAKNMIWFYENHVGVGRTKVKRVELENFLTMKHEDTIF